MTFVIPMAGRGERFKKAGYALPKMLLEAHGKTLLEWSVNSLPLQLCTNLIFIGLEEHNTDYNLEQLINNKYGSFQPQFLWLKETTRGQAETVYMAKHLYDLDLDLLIFNIDTMFYSQSLASILKTSKWDGILGSFESNEARFSYAKINSDQIVVETAEKIVISKHALTGMYHFKRASDFIRIVQKHLDQNLLSGGEFYIAPMYNDLIEEGKEFTIDICEDHWILGTPDELKYFETYYIPV